MRNASAANPDASAEIEVTTRVVATQVEPMGANLGTIAGGTNFAINNHVWGSGFEPTVWRKQVRVDRAGDNWIEWDGLGGVSYWNLTWTGFGNGATIRFYRIVDASGQPLAYTDGLWDATGANRVIFLGETTVPMPSTAFPEGGWIANTTQERVYISQSGLGLRRGDYAFIVQKTNYFPVETSAPQFRVSWGGGKGGFTAVSGAFTALRVPHPAKPLPADFIEPGETCLEITAPQAEEVSLGQYVYHGLDAVEGSYYSQLRPGAPYRVEVWMRQEGLANGGKVAFQFNTGSYATVSQQTPWTVTGDWKKYTYDFVAPGYPNAADAHIAHGLRFTGPGKLWIDNFILYRNDAAHGFAPFGPHEISFNELMSTMPQVGKKPALRFFGFTYSFNPHALVTSMFGNYPNSTYVVDWYTELTGGPPGTIAQAMTWALRTGDRPENRVVPYLTCPEEYNEAEWRALIEYLGVPYDPATDSPARKPYAYQRYVYRGLNGRPWTDEFREILVEYGNETWHNGAGGYGWDGFGAPGAVHLGGREYGLFARYMFDENVGRMPEWSQYALARKIKFVLGGNYNFELDTDVAYGELAVQKSSVISYVGHANYVGPKWETGDVGSTTFNDHGVQETLVGAYTTMFPVIAGATAARDQLADAGTHYQVIAYEGGPSGYWQNMNNQIVDEKYGKSLAMGVAALDAWLYSSERGYTYQAYLGYQSGKWWSSHTMPEAGEFRAHAGWLALKMRNLYALGNEMVETRMTKVPTYSRNGQDIPLVSAYTMRDANAHYVFVLSRKLDGNHDGVNFGDGYTPVKLRLPFGQPARITLHRLAHPDGTPADPRESNLDSSKIAIVSQAIDASRFSRDFQIDDRTGGSARGMPPGTAFLYVFEQAIVGADAGAVADAGAARDAGVAPDAGLSLIDAGIVLGGGGAPEGAASPGGCGCSLLGSSKRDALALVFLGGLVAWWSWRRVRPSKRNRLGLFLALLVAVSVSTGCGSGLTPAEVGLSGSYQQTQGQEATTIASDMWQSLSSARCWTPQHTTNNYAFYGNYEWRYAGTSDTYAGTLGLVSAGRFGDRKAALVNLRDETQLIVILDPQSIAIGFWYNGSPVVNRFVASATCV